MNILVLSQTFWPDTVATAQALTDLAIALSKRGHKVRVLTSRCNYENPEIKYPLNEIFEGIEIIRLRDINYGKRTISERLMVFFSFNLLVFFRLLFSANGNPDLIISLTSPPLLPVIGIVASRLRNIRFVYWTMDLQPELSIANNFIRKGSPLAKILQKMGDFVFHKADKIITLDDYMAKHIFVRTGRVKSLAVLPIWPMVKDHYYGTIAENPFVQEHGLAGRCIVMYAGNHSLVHPVETLLDAATSMKDDQRFLFVHIGGGFRLKEVMDRKNNAGLGNMKILPFQPREKIHFSLGAADLQVVIMGNNCVGLTHPNKIYSAMYLGKPILYIGPQKSHITDILNDCPGNIEVRHGESFQLVEKLVTFITLPEETREHIGQQNRLYAQQKFDPETLINRMVEEIESVL